MSRQPYHNDEQVLSHLFSELTAVPRDVLVALFHEDIVWADRDALVDFALLTWSRRHEEKEGFPVVKDEWWTSVMLKRVSRKNSESHGKNV